MYNDDAGARRAAIARLTDQESLASLVRWESRDRDLWGPALERLRDDRVLSDLATQDLPMDVRAAAVARVSDQARVRAWALTAPAAAIRRAAVTRVLDDGFLVQRLAVETSAAVRESIIETLHGRDVVRSVALTAYREGDRELALRRLRSAFRDPAGDVIAAHRALAQRVRAIARQTGVEELVSLALRGEFDVLRVAAAQRLTATAALEQVAMQGTDRGVLRAVLSRLDDKAARRSAHCRLTLRRPPGRGGQRRSERLLESHPTR